jgi:dUTP pyrophosphatase
MGLLELEKRVFELEQIINKKPEIKFKKTDENAIMPIYAHSTDSGMDLYSISDIIIPANGFAVIPVGLDLADLECNYELHFRTRSSMGFKNCLFCYPGLVDETWRGNMDPKIYNFSKEDYLVKKGDRVAQLVISRRTQGSIIEATEKNMNVERGLKGWGSSGK